MARDNPSRREAAHSVQPSKDTPDVNANEQLLAECQQQKRPLRRVFSRATIAAGLLFISPVCFEHGMAFAAIEIHGRDIVP